MLDVALAQLRFAASIAFGIPFSVQSLDRLVAAIRDTQHEFCRFDTESDELLRGPTLDEETRREMQLRRFRAQAKRAARETEYYPQLFQRLDLDPARLGYDDIARIPPTSKDALRCDPDAFVRRTSNPYLRAMTTGTTGCPTSVYFSEQELYTIVALSALGFLLHEQISSEDIVQISTSSRATLGNIGLAGACARIGATTYLTGVVQPAQTLALLTEDHRLAGKKPRVSILSTYPSYLGELVECGLGAGYHQSQFGLERIFVGGEIVTEGLKNRCQQLFGSVQVITNYAMTETIPFGGTTCSENHLHFEPSHGLLEVLKPETGAPASVREPGSIVATPFPPFRETTILLRYDTQDMVRTIAEPLTCNLRHLPATGPLLGKSSLCVRHESGWTFPRDVLEALEAVDEVSLPARCGFWSVSGGVAVEVVTRQDRSDLRRKIDRSLEEQGVPLRALHLVQDRSQLKHPIPLRCDLKESSFRPQRAGDARATVGRGN